MKDKDLLVVIAEMLRKQDQQTEILKKNNETLATFVEVSIKQFDEQHKFNEKFLALNETIVDRLDKIEKKL